MAESSSLSTKSIYSIYQSNPGFYQTITADHILLVSSSLLNSCGACKIGKLFEVEIESSIFDAYNNNIANVSYLEF